MKRPTEVSKLTVFVEAAGTKWTRALTMTEILAMLFPVHVRYSEIFFESYCQWSPPL